MVRTFPAILLMLLLSAQAWASPPLGHVGFDCDNASLGDGQYQLTCGSDITNYEEGGQFLAVDLTTPDATCPGSFTHCFSKNRLKAYVNTNDGIFAMGTDKDTYLEVRAHPVNPITVNIQVENKHRVRVYRDTTNVHYNFFATPEGMKVDFELLNSNAPDVFTLGFRLIGLELQGRNIYRGPPAEGHLVGTLPNPFIVDANGIIIPVVEVIEEASDSVYLSYNKTLVTAWPAVLDPGLTIETGDKDYEAQSNNVNVDTSAWQELEVRSSGGVLKRVFYGFDFSPLDDTAAITDATLTLWCVTAYASNFGDMGVYRTTTDWTEEGTWNCARDDNHDGTCDVDWTTDGGDFTTDGGATTAVDCSDFHPPLDWDWDVTTMVQWFQANASEYASFIVKDPDDGTPNGIIWFRSREDATYGPKLVITYELGGGIINFERPTGRGIGRGIR